MTALTIFILCYLLVHLIGAIKASDTLAALIWGIGFVLVLVEVVRGHPALG